MKDIKSDRVYRSELKDSAAWRPVDLQSSGNWQLELTTAHIDDLHRALEQILKTELPLEKINKDNFPLPNSEKVIQQIKDELKIGKGFVLLHGFPVNGQEPEDISKMYWGFCSHLGIGVTQNSDAGLIHYVTEGQLRPNQGTRGVGNPGKVSLHVDLADCVTLLCVRQAEDSPKSALSSSLTVHNMLAKRNWNVLERLYAGYFWDRQNEHGTKESPTTDYRVPMFSQKDGVVSCRYNRNWITKAFEREAKNVPLEDAVLFDLFDEIAHENRFEFDFVPGDIQFANNYVMLHGRSPHVPARSEETTRLLMRIWFNMDNIRVFSDEAIVRHGILRHGKLGWTAKDLVNGIEGRIHLRRKNDSAPVFD